MLAYPPTSLTLAKIIVVERQSAGWLVECLTRFSGDVRLVTDIAALRAERGSLVVGSFARNEATELTSFATAAKEVNLTAITVEQDNHTLLVGPVAIPGRPGCAYCSWSRRVAAAGRIPEQSANVVTVLERSEEKVAARILKREVLAILRRGPTRSALVDHVLAVDLGESDESLHRVIPLSRCLVCGGAATLSRTVKRTTRIGPTHSPTTVMRALEGWVDKITGVIGSVVLEPPDDDNARMPFVVSAAPPYVVDDDGALKRLPLGWGKGFTISGALLSAVGEAIERYAASLPDPDSITWNPAEDLDAPVLDPRELVFYSPEQYGSDGFPYSRFNPDVCHPWVKGTWLGRDTSVWVPAIFTYLSLSLRSEQLLCQGSSNGLAASFDAETAAVSAVMELIERDAFMTAWITRRPAERIILDDSLESHFASIIEGFERLGATVEIYRLPTSVCGTTILGLALGDGKRYPGVTLGLGTDLDARSAFGKALLELAQTGPHLRRMMLSGAWPVPKCPSDVQAMLDHAAYYFPAERRSELDWLRRGESSIKLGELRGSNQRTGIEACASALDAASVRVALADVTSPDVALSPFRVVRAVSPDLQPLWYGYGFERLNTRRLDLSPCVAPNCGIHPIW